MATPLVPSPTDIQLQNRQNAAAQPTGVTTPYVTPSQYGTVQNGSFIATPDASNPINPNYVPPATPNVTPPVQPQTEDDIYGNYVKQGQSIIDQINNSAAGQIAAANAQIDTAAGVAQQNQNGIAAITGGFGSSSAAGATGIASTAAGQKNTADSAIQADAQKQVSTYLQNLQSAAQSQANYEQTTAFSQGLTYDQYLKTTAASTLQGLSKQGVTIQSLKQQAQSGNPVAQQSYQTLLQAYGGDENQLNAAAALSQPVNTVVQSWMQGSTYYQIVQNPQTGAITTQSFDMGVTMPTNWTTTKIGTTGQFFQDPSNSANTFTLTTDPSTGGITAVGTGTGTTLADQYNQANGSNTPGTNSNSSQSNNTATTTVATALGVDPTTPLSDVLQNQGVGALTAAIIKNEGGSPDGVQNNPGNVKYEGLPGQTDSEVKASDGGTYASYATPQAGQQAIASIVNDAASGASTAYGSNPTLQDFVQKYTNTGGTTLSTDQYGALANVQGFDPTKPGVDQDAMTYIQNFFSNGTIPSVTMFGRGTNAPYIYEAAKSRADDVYFQATGQHLPNANTLSSNIGLIQNNNQLLNNLSIQEGTISKNFGLNLDNLNANSVNQAAPVINKLVDTLAQMSGDVPVAQYLTQNATIQQELGSLLAIKNASGTTVADKLAAGDLLPSDLSADQQKVILQTLMKEANNQKTTLGETTANLYQKTDPLGLDPENPIRQPGYQELTSSGFTPNYDGTYTDSQGNSGYTVSNGQLLDANGTPVATIQ